MEEMNAKVMENEELEDITEVEEAEESGSAGALVAGVVGGFLAYARIGGRRCSGKYGDPEGDCWRYARQGDCQAAELARVPGGSV